MIQRVSDSLVLASVAAVLLGCSSERATQPVPVSYAIYVAADRFGSAYVADLATLTVIDSISDVGNAPFISALPDGRTLFFGCDDPSLGRRLLRYSTSTKTFDASLPTSRAAWAISLRNSRFILTYVDSMEIVDVATFVSVGGVSRAYQPIPSLDADSEVAAEMGDSAIYRILNVFDGQLRGEYRPHLMDGTPITIRPTSARVYHAESRRLIMLVQGPHGHGWAHVLVGDVETGETLLEHEISFPLGDIAVSNDRRLFAVSDPSNWEFFQTPVSIELFDFENLVHIRRLSLGDLPELESLSRLAFLPGDTTLAAMPGRNLDGGPFHLIDLRSFTITHTALIPSTPSSTGGVAIGVR